MEINQMHMKRLLSFLSTERVLQPHVVLFNICQLQNCKSFNLEMNLKTLDFTLRNNVPLHQHSFI